MLIRFLIYDIYTIGGTVKTVSNLANALARRGHDIEIISVIRSAREPLYLFDPNVTIITLADELDITKKKSKKKSRLLHVQEPVYATYDANLDELLIEKLRSLRGGVLITTLPSFNRISGEYVHKSVIKIGQEYEGLLGYPEGIISMIEKSYGKLDALTTLTDYNYRLYRDLIPQKELIIHVLGHGTEQMFTQAPLKNKVILAAGRYVEQKGFDLLIEAFTLVAKEFPDWTLKLFGRGGLRTELSKQIVDNHMERQIFLCPATNGLLKEISKSAFYVCSSRYEPFGMILIEAMSVGVPIVSFACEGPTEIVEDGKTGILVRQQEVNELAEGMKTLMENEQLRKAMGESAQQKSKKYSVQSIAETMESIILEVKNKRQQV